MLYTILIVDDQPSHREVLKGLLTDQEYNLAFAQSGVEALTQATKLMPDLILLDVMMPGMDGFEVCRRIRATPSLAEIPIVMVTALDNQASRIEGLEAGADDFVSKPFHRVELQARVRTITRLNRYRQLLIERAQRQKAEGAVYHIHAILDALGEAVFVTDVAGKIRYLNPAAVALTGFSEEEAKGQDWRLWQGHRIGESSDAGDQLYDEIRATVHTGRLWRGEVKNKRKDGTLYEVILTVAALPDPDEPEQIMGFVCLHNDITLLKQAEQLRAMQQEREKQVALDRLRHTFLSTVNHEMRTPLMLVFQTLQMLEDPELGPLTEQQLDTLTTLRRQSMLLGRMIEGLTRVAAFISKQETVRPVPAVLTPVFHNLIPWAEFKARSKEVTIKTDIAPDLPSFCVDVKQIEEALIQLVDNAIKFNRPGGKVHIRAWADKQWVMVAITDTGVGIEADLLKQVWEIFEQGVDPIRRAQEGLGLGLFLARHIIEAHHGVIEIETTPGQGSIFRVKLPITNPEQPCKDPYKK